MWVLGVLVITKTIPGRKTKERFSSKSIRIGFSIVIIVCRAGGKFKVARIENQNQPLRIPERQNEILNPLTVSISELCNGYDWYAVVCYFNADSILLSGISHIMATKTNKPHEIKGCK